MLSQGPDTVHWVQIVQPGSIHCTDSPKSIQKYFGQSPGSLDRVHTVQTGSRHLPETVQV